MSRAAGYAGRLLSLLIRQKMKMKRKHLVIAAGVVLAAHLVAHARSPVPPPTVDKIADTWIGFCEDDLYYYRLTLGANGTGMCANTFVREPAKLYRATKWTLDGYAIEIKLQPVDPEAEPIWMKGKTAIFVRPFLYRCF